jgi:hypothetical protein
MKKYSLTSVAFDGEVVFEFDDAGLLLRFDMSQASLSEDQQLFILRKIPRELSEVQRVIANSDTAKLTEIDTEVSFEAFWNRYDEKIRSSKKKSLKIWHRLSKTDKIKAFRFIQKYEMSLYQGTAKKYAETYLNSELWNN